MLLYYKHLKYHFIVLQLGSTAIGIQTSEGVVLAVEKRVTSPLIEPASIEKVMEVDTHIGRYLVQLCFISIWMWEYTVPQTHFLMHRGVGNMQERLQRRIVTAGSVEE